MFAIYCKLLCWRLFLCVLRIMRRSGAPSQLLGNAMKKPRFMPPASSSSYTVPEIKPFSPKPGLGNTLEKVTFSLFHSSYFACLFALFYVVHHCIQLLVFINWILIWFSSLPHPAGTEKSSSTGCEQNRAQSYCICSGLVKGSGSCAQCSGNQRKWSRDGPPQRWPGRVWRGQQTIR